MYNSTEELYSSLEEQGVTVFACSMKGTSAAISSSDGFIGLDYNRIHNQQEEATVLIHEEGHFSSGAFYVPYSPYQIKAQAEYRADKAAALKRVPLRALVADMRCGLSIWEIAEHFNVTPAFIWRAYTIYRDHMGVDFAALA